MANNRMGRLLVVQKCPFYRTTLLEGFLNYICFSERSLWNSNQKNRLIWSFLTIFDISYLIPAEVISTTRFRPPKLVQVNSKKKNIRPLLLKYLCGHGHTTKLIHMPLTLQELNQCTYVFLNAASYSCCLGFQVS